MRTLSTFFQNVVTLAGSRVIGLKEIYSVLVQCSLEIIPKIIIPLETLAIPPLFGNKPPADLPEDFKHLMELHRMAPEIPSAGPRVRRRHRRLLRSWARTDRRRVK